MAIAVGTNVTAGEVQRLCPIGTIVLYAGPTGTSIAGWLECNGTPVSRTTYGTLFANIGTAFGSGDGSTTFNVPDFRSRVPVGAGQGAGPRTGTATGTPTGTPLSMRLRGQWSGEETHLLTTPEMPAHAHVVAQGNSGGTGSSLQATSNTGAEVTGTVGSSTAHNISMPFIVINYIIKYDHI